MRQEGGEGTLRAQPIHLGRSRGDIKKKKNGEERGGGRASFFGTVRVAWTTTGWTDNCQLQVQPPAL